MHEMAFVLNIVDTVDYLAKKHQVHRIGYVKIELGELGGALPKYMYELWPLGTKDTICENAQLIIEEVSSVVRCSRCGKEYPPIQNLMNNLPVCPICGYDHYSIVSGANITVTELGVEDVPS